MDWCWKIGKFLAIFSQLKKSKGWKSQKEVLVICQSFSQATTRVHFQPDEKYPKREFSFVFFKFSFQLFLLRRSIVGDDLGWRKSRRWDHKKGCVSRKTKRKRERKRERTRPDKKNLFFSRGLVFPWATSFSVCNTASKEKNHFSLIFFPPSHRPISCTQQTREMGGGRGGWWNVVPIQMGRISWIIQNVIQCLQNLFPLIDGIAIEPTSVLLYDEQLHYLL